MARIGMGAIYLAMLVFRPRRAYRGVLWVIVVVAVLMRVGWFFVPLSSGEDHCRYLWDGAVTANGINPYRYSPKQVLDMQMDNPTIEQLAKSGRATLEGINHSELRTIYPPAAQGAFALGYWITPFSLTGWRIVLLGFDALAVLGVLGLLRASGLSLLLVFIYLWNPLLVTETYGFCHLDMLTAALVILFAWALSINRPVVATVALGLGIGVKLWPVLLLPFLLRSLWGKWQRLAATMGILAVMLGAMAVPFASAFGSQANSGLLTYGRIWTGHSGVYLALDKLGWWLHGFFSLGMDGNYVGRALMMIVLLPAVFWLGLRRPRDTSTLCRRMALVILLMLLLSPTLWPWYYIAVIPLGVVASRRIGLLFWSMLLPLCYLEGMGLSAWQLTWVVHLPVWLVLAVECVRPHLFGRLRLEAAHA